MVPINMQPDKIDHLAQTFGCSKGTLPFTYLGLPLGLTKLKVEDFFCIYCIDVNSVWSVPQVFFVSNWKVTIDKFSFLDMASILTFVPSKSMPQSLSRLISITSTACGELRICMLELHPN